MITAKPERARKMVAKVIHYSGQRRHGPFMAVNCTAVPDTCSKANSSASKKAWPQAWRNAGD
jgi:DNA-binding NtrC family response regulator